MAFSRMKNGLQIFVDGTLACGFFRHRLPQGFSGLEVGHAPLGYLNRLARSRIAPLAGRPLERRKTAEPPDLDALALGQGKRHGMEQDVHGGLHITAAEQAEAFGQ